MSLIGNGAYSLRRVAVTINGVPLSGAADGDFVTITPNANVHDKTPGARGEYAVSATNDRGATITFNVFQGSTVNRNVLETVARQQRDLGLGPATLAVIEVTDLETGEEITCPRCWIETLPTRNFGQQQQGREYVFATDEYILAPITA